MRICKKCHKKPELFNEDGTKRRGYCESCEPLCEWGRNRYGVPWEAIPLEQRPYGMSNPPSSACCERTHNKSRFCEAHQKIAIELAEQRRVVVEKPKPPRSHDARENITETRHGS